MSSFRFVSIEKPSKLYIHLHQLHVLQGEDDIAIPVDDIEILMVDGPSINMTTMCMAQLAEAGVVVLVVGNKHMPAALSLPFAGSARQARIAAQHCAASESLKKEIWNMIVVRKIENQAEALRILGLDNGESVLKCAEGVADGDSSNYEAVAAKAYFEILQPGLGRREDDLFNSAINYGYAIIRASIARRVVSMGFIPSLGVHHCSQLNSFNLVDDLVEPFRPVVDMVAYDLVLEGDELTQGMRSALRRTLLAGVSVEGVLISVSEAIGVQVSSLRDAICGKDPCSISLPSVIPLTYLDPVKV